MALRPKPSVVSKLARSFQLAIVKREAFALAVFEKELAIVHAAERILDDAFGARPVEPGAGEEQIVGGGKIAHICFLLGARRGGSMLG